MRHLNAAVVVVRLRIKSELYHLQVKHGKWGDWTFVGGYAEPKEKNDWAQTAQRKCTEELNPLRFGVDFILLPLLTQPLQWAESFLNGGDGGITTVTAQLFMLRLLTSPTECLRKLPLREFRIIRESWIERDGLAHDVLGALDPKSLSWDQDLPSVPDLRVG